MSEPVILASDAARALRISPITLWEVVTGRSPSAYTPERQVPVNDVCDRYRVTRAALNRVLAGYDSLLTPTEAAARLGIGLSTFWRRNSVAAPVVHKGDGRGAVLRYSRVQIDTLAASGIFKVRGRAA